MSSTAIPVNRCLTECISSVKPRLLPDKLLILSNLSVKSSLFTDKLSILSQLFTVIRFHGGKQDSLTPQKAKHPCRLTDVSEAEQLHRPLRIVSLPRIIRITQSSSTSHVSKGCTQMSLTAATRLPPWGLAYLNPPRPPFQGGDQGLQAFQRRTAALPANSGPASDDALFGTRGRRLRSRRAWSLRRLLVAGHDHFGQLEIFATLPTSYRLKI